MDKRNHLIIDQRILADLRIAEEPSGWLVIFCHGYKGFKDWGAWNLIAEEFVSGGIDFLKFNFSLNGGTLEDPIDFPDLDAFGRNTYSQEVQDVKCVIDYVAMKFPKKKIALIGHSRGGGIATLSAAQNQRVKKLITWAGVCDYKRRFPVGEALLEWQETGVWYVMNGRTHQKMPHYYSFYEDFVSNEDQLDILKWTERLHIPHLIVHGFQDQSVKISEAHELKKANPSAETYFLEANHVFGASHPYLSSFLPSELDQVVNRTMKFIV